MAADIERRFGGVGRLYGTATAEALARARVCVVGIGGVGSWVVEALVRSGVGHLTLIDLDMVAESNTNRQIHALDDVYGKAKVLAMAERGKLINPACDFTLVEDFLTPENCADLLSASFDVVVDAIDQAKAKVAIIDHCHQLGVPVVVAGAAGGQVDPTQITVSDLANTVQDPLLAKVRSQLRKFHGFPKAGSGKFGVPAVYSTEQLRYPEPANACDAGTAGLNGLSCAGFGSSVCVTGTFGLVAAAQAISLIGRRKS